ncbi:MAG TPA: glycosyltransferase family 9 protein [Phnomibacter sp.]|nr:glycosyltransferase family 9 protein [Phnomibacter sp.]
MPKFLIIRFSSIGDIVLTTPVVRCLKQQVAGAEVHYLTKAGSASLLEANPYIDKLHLHEGDLKDTIKRLRAEHFDHIIDLHHNLRTLRVKRALGVKGRSFNKLNFEKWLMTAFKIDRLPSVHIVDRYLETVEDFGVMNDGKGLDFFIPEEKRVDPAHLPETHRSGFAGLVIGAALATKKLPEEKLRQICTGLKYPIVLLGGPEDAEAGQRIASQQPHVFNACGGFTLLQSADLVRQARVIVTHDTGLMHIAAAFCKPIVSIWGNTIPAFGMGPYFPADHQPWAFSFEVEKLSCRPCSKIGYKKCPKGHFKCMQMQDTDAILGKVRAYLNPIS